MLLACGMAATVCTAARAQVEPVPDPPATVINVGPVGWPVWPVNRQHPIRGGFLDPRPSGASGVVLHNGVDINVRDDQPEIGHPFMRTHRVYALEPGVADIAADVAKRRCSGRRVRIGRFTYSHVDPAGSVAAGDTVKEGDLIGWTCTGQWHVHLTERDGTSVVNPLRRDGRLRPYVDAAPPLIRAITFYEPSDFRWFEIGGSIISLADGWRLSPRSLRGEVEVRASIADVPSFHGWFAALAPLALAQVPYEVQTSLRRVGGAFIWRRIVFRSDVFRAPGTPLAPAFAAGTRENLSTQMCRSLRWPRDCDGALWFKLGGASGTTWNTRTLANGSYEYCVTASDPVGNRSRRCTRVTIAN